jgi:tetratricopeptide (TPR) repeat protein
MKRKNLIIPLTVTCFVLFLLNTNFCIGQTPSELKIDSLKKVIRNFHSNCSPCLQDSSKIIALLELVLQYNNINDDSALIYIDEGISVAEKTGYHTGIGRLFQQKGNYYYGKADYAVALSFYDKAMKQWEIIESSPAKDEWAVTEIRKAKTLSMYGGIYNERGNHPKAIDYYLAALKIIEPSGDSNLLARLYGGMGNTYASMNEYDKAMNYYLNTLHISEARGDINTLSNVTASISNIYFEQHKYSEALEYSVKALELSEQNNDMRGKAYALTAIGNTYQEQKLFDKSLEYFTKAIKISDEINDGFLSTNLRVNIGAAYFYQKKYAPAILYLNQGLKLAENNSILNLAKEAHGYLKSVYESTGNYQEAMLHFEKEIAAKDSLFNKDKIKEITLMEIGYDQEKKDAISNAAREKIATAQMAELQKQKLIRNSIAGGSGIIFISSLLTFFFYKRKRDAEHKQKETFLSLQVSETEMKALRSQMNPHFIFNALQSIQTFLLSHQSEEANLYLLKFSKLMRSVLENSQHSEVTLKEDMKALELYMQLESIRLQHPFTYDFHIDKSVDIETDFLPPLILQPFVENAIWHGLQYKPEAGHINIFITKKGNALYATVEDNGIGRDMSRKVAQPMLLKKESLGMKLTEERLKVLNEIKKFNAKFTITDLFTKDNQPSGTKVELSLPLVA